FGPAFAAVVRSVGPLAPPERRGALLAAVYIVTYCAFSIPSVLAGIGASLFGLRATTYGYGVTVIVLAAITTVALLRQPATERAGG
ncbi:MAG: MFS transporter, partial [Chloroflexota bacterium]|nr:MFS transporter [Chloroflexota bacterium]